MNVILIFVLLFAGSITYSCYENIIQASRDSINLNDVHDYVMKNTYYYNYLLNMKLNGYSLDQYLIIDGEETDELVEDINYYNDIFNSYADYLEDESDIYYYAEDIQTGAMLSNTDDNISLVNNNVDLQNKYIYYIQIEFNENGQMHVNFSYDDSLDIYYDYNTTYTYYEGNNEGSLTLTSPTNMTVTYAVTSDIILNGQLDGYSSNIETYFRFTLPYIAFMTLAMMLITLITPMKYLKDSSILSFIARIKFGILTLLWCGLFFIMVNIGGRVVVLSTLRDEWDVFLEYFSLSQIGPYFIPIINVIFWMCFYFLFIVLVYMIKYFFHKGIKKYMKENTLISWLIIQFKKLIQYVLTFNFNDHMSIVTAKILLVNLCVFIICCLLGKIGIILAIIYTLTIFYILLKKI